MTIKKIGTWRNLNINHYQLKPVVIDGTAEEAKSAGGQSDNLLVEVSAGSELRRGVKPLPELHEVKEVYDEVNRARSRSARMVADEGKGYFEIIASALTAREAKGREKAKKKEKRKRCSTFLHRGAGAGLHKSQFLREMWPEAYPEE